MMSSADSKKLILGGMILGVVLIGGFAASLLAAPSEERTGAVHEVVLREDGWEPREITIQKGDTVVFSTERDAPFWPASNLHPVHEIYPQFDPRRPIEPDATWSFTFTRVGEWEFHDHLYSPFTGRIIVEGTSADAAAASCGSARQCWDKTVREAVADKGVSGGLETLAHLYDTTPAFRSDCHGYAHIVGEEAFPLFDQDSEISLNEKTAYCGYGFFHGFMETMLFTTGSVAQAREFCQFVDDELAETSALGSTACYHGIGHGAVDGADPRDWGDPHAMATPGFKLCEAVAQTDHQRYLCATGVFNALEILSQDARYELTGIRHDPFAFCNEQPDARKEACYTNMLPAVLRITENDFSAAAEYVHTYVANPNDITVNEDRVLDVVISSLFNEYIRVYGEEPDYQPRALAVCRGLSPDLTEPCFEGLYAGHIKYGTPGAGYADALAFCDDAALSGKRRDSCRAFILRHLTRWYGRGEASEICRSVAREEERQWCKYGTTGNT